MDKKFEIVMNDIKQKISQKIYTPGKVLPKEIEMVEQYGFSRITIQKALKELVNQGLIYRVSGKGTYIRDRYLEPQTNTPNFFVVLPYKSNEIFKLVYGIESEMVKNNYLFSFFFINSFEEGNASSYVDYDAFLFYLSKLNPQGIFCYAPNSIEGGSGYREILNKKIPLILLDKEMPKCPVNSVVSDNYMGMYELTQYVIDKGHKNIGYLSFDMSFGDTIIKRKAGFLDCLADNKIEIKKEYIKDYAMNFDYIGLILDDLLKSAPEVTAIICSNDSIAELCYPELKKRGMNIPGDISVCAFDGYEEGKKLDPPLTSMEQNLYGIGKKAAQAMIEIYQKPKNEPDINCFFKYYIPAVLVEKDSVSAI